MTKLVTLKSGEPYDVYIGRGSVFGNNFTHIKNRKTLATHIVSNRKEAIEKYREYILNSPELLNKIQELRGKTMACFCINTDDYNDGDKIVCHGQVIQQILKFGINKLF